MSMIRDLSIFIMETGTEEDKRKMANLLENLTGKILGDKESAAGIYLKVYGYIDSIPDVEAESLNTGERKLGEAIAAVQSGKIKVNYTSFVLTYSLLRQKAEEMEAEYQKLQNALDYLTDDWIGEDQKAFVQAGIGFQKELNDRIKEVRGMADKLDAIVELGRYRTYIIVKNHLGLKDY